MVATFTEPLDSVLNVLKTWTRGNTDNIKPVIIDIADEKPERGKRLDLGRHDYVLCYETAHNEEWRMKSEDSSKLLGKETESTSIEW